MRKARRFASAKGRVDAVWTLWKPPGWHLRELRARSSGELAHRRWGALVTVPCGYYEARIASRRGATTVLYVYGGQLWGFGLSRQNAQVCH